jgi:hypothetical protein
MFLLDIIFLKYSANSLLLFNEPEFNKFVLKFLLLVDSFLIYATSIVQINLGDYIDKYFILL